MRELKFEGMLDCFAGHLCATGPHVEGRSIIDEVEEMWPGAWNRTGPQLKVFLGTQPDPHMGVTMDGDFYANHGFGGTDITPSDPPEIRIGDIDLMAELYKHDDEVVLIIFEGP
jgi:hypothetical protein